jgi:hypothetical protein
VSPKRSTFDWVLEAISLAALALTVAGVLAHWGRPNQWGSMIGLLVMPAVTAGVYILLTAVPRYPQLLNLPFEVDRSDPVVQALVLTMTSMLKAEAILMFLYIEWPASGGSEGLGRVFLPLALATMLITAGTFLVRLHRCRR